LQRGKDWPRQESKTSARIDPRRQPLNPHTASGGAETIMPRATWKGFLRLSLVSCPVYLLPASSRTKAIRLNQVWVPGGMSNRASIDNEDEEDSPARRTDRFAQGQSSEEPRSFVAPPTAYEDRQHTSRDRASFADQPEYEAPATRSRCGRSIAIPAKRSSATRW
jgi:hypothetical protein